MLNDIFLLNSNLANLNTIAIFIANKNYKEDKEPWPSRQLKGSIFPDGENKYLEKEKWSKISTWRREKLNSFRIQVI